MINSIGTHQHVIKMQENEQFDEFMDRLKKILDVFERVIYRDTHMNLYKKKIMSRTDIFDEKKVSRMDEDCIVQYIVRERVKILLKYRYISL